MNEYGFGIKESMIFIITIFVCMFVVTFIYNRTFVEIFSGEKAKSYGEIENRLVHAGKVYTDNFYYKVLENGDNGYVPLYVLKDDDIVNDIYDIRDSSVLCNGYVSFSRKDDKTSYKSYIRCGDNYKTNGYNKRYEK